MHQFYREYYGSFGFEGAVPISQKHAALLRTLRKKNVTQEQLVEAFLAEFSLQVYAAARAFGLSHTQTIEEAERIDAAYVRLRGRYGLCHREALEGKDMMRTSRELYGAVLDHECHARAVGIFALGERLIAQSEIEPATGWETLAGLYRSNPRYRKLAALEDAFWAYVIRAGWIEDGFRPGNDAIEQLMVEPVS